jgi:hypothetical protein
LLELHVGEVVANHHLEDVEELPVGDVAILIDVIDLEGEDKLLLFVSAIQGGQT